MLDWLLTSHLAFVDLPSVPTLAIAHNVILLTVGERDNKQQAVKYISVMDKG